MSDIIGFLIVLFVFLFPFFVQLLNKKRREAEAQNEPFKPEVKVLSKKKEPFVRKKVVPDSDFQFHSHLDDYKQESRIEKRHIQTKIAPDVAVKAEKKFAYDDDSPKIPRKKKKISLKQMVIYSEIYDSTKFN